MDSPLFLPTEANEIDDLDNISITSTDAGASEDEDKEWHVDKIYAERPDPDMPGEMQYLIKWEDFPIDQCTWEPTEHLGSVLLSEWEEIKKASPDGKEQALNVEMFNIAYKARYARHTRRNAKRERLGLPLTYQTPPASEPTVEPPAQELSSPVVPINDPNARVEPQKISDLDKNHSSSNMQTQNVVKRKPPSENAPEKPRAEVNAAQNVNKKKPIAKPIPKPSTQKSTPKSPLQPPASLPPRPGVKKRTATGDGKPGATMTGYQGTARKPSAGMNLGPSKEPVGKAPTQKGPGAASGPSTMPPKLSTSLANKFAGNRHTATRTRPQQTSTAPARVTNVFIGGKERKKRASLSEVMDNATKAPKAFSSMRVMNIAKKKGIEKNDAAHPDFSSIPASFFLDGQNNQSKAEQKKAKPPHIITTSPTIVQSPTAISPSSTSIATPTIKTKKSVRFTGAEDEPMSDVVDDVANRTSGGQESSKRPPVPPVSPGPPGPPAPPRQAGPSSPVCRKLSLSTYQERSSSQVVAKAAVFGKATEPMRVLFYGISRQGQPWLSAFIAMGKLDFGTICASYNFVHHKAFLVEEVLSTGRIMSPTEETKPALVNVGEHLRRDSRGCHLVTEQFSILVYPSRCNGWDGLDLKVDISMDKDNAESPLRYIIYKSSLDVRLYPPISIQHDLALPNYTESGSHRQVLMKNLLGLDFSQFLPQVPKQKEKQVFMLFFPEREMQVCNMIKLWLRSCQPGCRIFSLEIKDSWSKFHETVKAGAAGTVILHEDMSAMIRKIPRIYQMIENKRYYTFWNLATGQCNPPKFPSDSYASIEPGTLQLTRMFPQGRAFLITPSLALSDPVRLHKFLDWYKSYCYNPHYIIVACADFPNYLKEVTLEKEKERREMCLAYKDSTRLEVSLADSGLTEGDLEARFKCWQTLKEITDSLGDEETTEEIRKVQWITDFIDPNDEQSLVNWFCWWSTQKCDQYRKFTVLGSSNSRIRAAYRHIEIPAYTKETVSDPDIALAREERQRREREAREAGEVTKDIKGSGQGAPPTPVFRPQPRFQSEIFKSDRPGHIRHWITSLFNEPRIESWLRVHAKAVSWLNVSMADHFDDPRCEFDTFKNWFGRTPPFTRGVNTWYGLFYTIDKDWDPQAPASIYGRHPWIAIFRPINPHFWGKYAAMELFIWDLSANARQLSHGNSSVLLDMQRRLVNLVREETHLRNPKFTLQEVYIGSKTDVEYGPGDNPLEITYKKLREMVINGSKWLPPFENLLRDQGWNSIPKSEWERGMAVENPNPSPVTQQQQGKPTPTHSNDKNKVQRSIWHAPRPKTKGGESKCVNHLYEAAVKARMSNESADTMRYQYRSTPDWYHDMKVEGRDSSHVNVDSTDKILSVLLQKK